MVIFFAGYSYPLFIINYNQSVEFIELIAMELMPIIAK